MHIGGVTIEASALQRVVRDLAVAELAVLRRTDPLFLLPLIDPEKRLGPDGVGLDSFEFITVAGSVSRMFGLGDAGIDDYLLARPTVVHWADLIGSVVHDPDARITFRTSGSTGQGQEVTHRLRDLADEATFFAELINAEGTCFVTVPTHHIYGFIFGVLVPACAGLSVADARGLGLTRVRPTADDVVISFPHSLSMLHRNSPEAGIAATVVSSTAPCPPDLAQAVRGRGTRLIEVYGSTETAGVGVREREGPYRLLPQWERRGDRIQRRSDGVTIPMPDEIEWIDDRAFLPLRRTDAAVQVGGVNVIPAEVERVLIAHPSVAEASVRLMKPSEGDRLKAFVVPSGSIFSEQELRAHVTQHLPSAARPAVYTVGPALPKNDMGKPSDWAVTPSTPAP